MLNKIIDKNFDELLERLGEIIKIPSVGADALPGMPYGEKCAEVLGCFLDIAKKEGFSTKNFENYVGTIEFNDKPAKLGVLCHLDVVPVTKKDWSYTPFEAQIDNGRLYGRGAIDNKGPAMAVLFALKAIKEAGIELKHNVRFIVGCDEERGSSDLEYYMKKEKMPPYVFTPDGDYPVINIEKGMLRLGFERKISFSHIKSMSGGTVVNAVPAYADAVVSGFDYEYLKNKASGNISVFEESNGIRIVYNGTAAHASTPSMGENAITGLVKFISKLELDNDEKVFFKNISESFSHNEFNGEHLGICMSDEKSGDLTAVLSIINYSEDSFKMKMDIRYPLCGNKDDIKEKIKNALHLSELVIKTEFENDPHCVDEDSEFIKTLLKVYHEQTGLETYCKAIGGGTYVHDIEGGVAFGAEFPGDVNNMHGNDESITLESLRMNTKIIANAIYEICK
ncbi:MAG: dipeptidase PepV [Oscillospiraceae bacterium]|nr:dipeptidase PepV [Oscillospiraceae bacterium]MBQ9981893.1 dipeptidase PepV [Oscillospiraceae bacterium]